MTKRLEGGYLGIRPTWNVTSNPGVWASEQVFYRRAAGTWPMGAGSFDEFYEYVTFLLHANGANASTSFPDSSLYGRAVTVSGNAQVSTAQSKFGGASIYFDGTGDSVQVATNDALRMNSDFTWEAWVYINALPASGYHTLWAQRATTGTIGGPCVVYDSAGNLLYFISDATGASWAISGTDSTLDITTNAWQHIALVKSGNNIKLYRNGIGGTGVAHSTAVAATANTVIGAGAADSGQSINGYIDELRITNGYARYTSNFPVPTGPGEDEGAPLADPFYNYVSLLLPMNGSNNSTTFTDKSPSAKTVTPTADAKLLTAVKRYGTASAYFDGVGDGISTTDVALGTGDFTIEMWINTTSTTQYAQLIGNENPGFTLLINNGTSTDGKIAIYVGTLVAVTSAGGYNDGKWHHIAVTRTGTALTIWVDGASGATATSSASYSGSGNLWIGRNNAYAGRDLIGYIDDLRITKGVARYVANFIPPLPHADYGTLVDPYLGSTSLLMPMEGPNNSTGFFDRADRLPVTTYGNAKISNAQYKWGLTSAYFDGNGDYLTIPAGTQFAYGSSDFTIELWLYKAASGSMAILDSTGSGGFGFLVNDTQVQSYVTNGATFTVAYSIPLNTWTHIAYSRSGTTLRLFVNGSQVGSNTDSNSYTSPADLNIGRNPNSNTAFLNGYIDDLRIVKGFAHYTTNFTPPTAAFNSNSINDPYRARVSLHLKMDGVNNSTTFTDSSAAPVTVTAVGDAKISTTQAKYGGASGYFDGTGDYLSCTLNALGTNDFTIETWVRMASFANYRMLYETRISDGDTSGFVWGVNASGQLFVYLGSFVLTTGTLATNTWSHVALTRASGTWRIFVDGVLQAGTYSNSVNLTRTAVRIGMDWATLYGASGYLDDYRITKGVARYTANFLPPTVEHPAF